MILIPDLTPLTWTELSDEEWYQFVIQFHDATWLDYIGLDQHCRAEHPFEFEKMQTCIRPRGHLGPHASGGNRFCYTSFKLWDSAQAVRYEGDPGRGWKCLECKYFPTVTLNPYAFNEEFRNLPRERNG